MFRYLLPGSHVMPTQIPVIGNMDIYGLAARRLLQLVPDTCNKAEQMYLDSLTKTSRPSSRGSSPPPLDGTPGRQTEMTSFSIATEDHGSNRVPSPGSYLTRRGRRGSNSSTCSSGNTSISGVSLQSALQQLTSAVSPGNHASPSASSTVDLDIFKLVPQEMGYLDYLLECRVAIRQCVEACRCWSSTYDRCIVTDHAPSRDPDPTPTSLAVTMTSGPQLNIQSPDGSPIPLDDPSNDSSQALPTSSPTSSPSILYVDGHSNVTQNHCTRDLETRPAYC